MYRGRSENLVELRDAILSGEEPFAVLLGNFLDQAYTNPGLSAVQAEPESLVGVMKNGEYFDAYLASIAEYLAAEFKIATPKWAEQGLRFLPSLRISVKNPRLRDVLIAECPEPFKRRGIIVSSNAMSRV
jgi:hypothetical protein